MRNKILIYCDYGTNDIGSLKRSLSEYFTPFGISIETTDAKEIISENSLNDEVLAFFMPGGRATPYVEKLKVQGNQKITEYVQRGGVYFGICAGAYYASRKVFFETDVKELCIIQQCGLNLIDADAIGTLYKELNISPYTMDFNSIAPVQVRWLADKERHIASYHGGPYFQPSENSSLQILAEYELSGNRLPAAVMQSHGKGIAIASGLHIEDSGKDLRHILFDLRKDKEKAQEVVTKLEENETSRQALFEKLMQKINIER
ncbi:MAG: BPL-N domain-containing protein [Acetobacter sp.]|nr:BPL-N domain-containing protein [Acetobacter sp.]